MTSRLFAVAALAVAAGCGPDPKPVPPPAADRTAEVVPEPAPKPVVVLTAKAVACLREAMKQNERRYLRVSVAKNGKYKLDLDDEMNPEADTLDASQGVPIVLDHEAAMLLPLGIGVDCVDTDGRPQFKFLPPAVTAPPDTSRTLAEARRGFRTRLVREEGGAGELATPPAAVFTLVRYAAAAGKLAAYLSPDPRDGKKHPAIIWITGSDCNTIDEGCWREGSPLAAGEYRKAGLVMMFPSLRGGNNNPGHREGFFGEVDDVLAAADYLAKQPYVDPARIYLGGHSTGGTLALLTAECSDRFRAVFSFGPAADVMRYAGEYAPFSKTDPRELDLRAAGRWLHGIRAPVFVFEGSVEGNDDSLREMATASKNPRVRFFVVDGANHFNVVGPTNRLIAERISRDIGPTCDLGFTAAEVGRPFRK